MATEKEKSAGAGIFALDCSATVYPYLATKKVNQIFRMALELDEQIDLDVLRKAVRNMPKRFPTMFVVLRKDRDTYRLQTMTDAESAICPEPAVYCQPFRLQNGENLIRVTYKGNRLGIEVFHAISDGAGGMILLKSLSAEYYRAKGEEIPCECGVCACTDPSLPRETEDSFRANYEPDIGGVSRAAKHAFQFSEKGPFEPWHQTELRIPLESLKSVTKSNNATITEYAAALYLDILRKHAQGSAKPVVLSVPINLRPIFDSQTLRNFSLYFLASVPQDKPDVSFEDILRAVHAQLQAGIDKDLLRRTIHQNVSQADLPIFVKSPRFVKKAILRIGAAMYGEGLYTSTFSNLGIFKLPEALAKHVVSFHAMLGESPVNHIKILSYCYNGVISLMFSSRLATRELENAMCARLRDAGIDFDVVTMP